MILESLFRTVRALVSADHLLTAQGVTMPSLPERLGVLARSYLQTYQGAWLVWCDQRRDWLPLLQRAARSSATGGLELIQSDG